MNTLFERRDEWEIEPSFGWVPKRLEWQIENVNTPKALTPETTGIEVLQGEGICEGRLLGGCVDVFPMLFGTALWPDAEAWRGAILMIETSEEELTPGLLLYFMRNMAATGVLGAINGIIVGRPYFGRNYDEYKTVLRQALREAGRENLPVLYNVNFGHSQPCSVLPIGCRAKIDCSARKLFITEPCVE